MTASSPTRGVKPARELLARIKEIGCWQVRAQTTRWAIARVNDGTNSLIEGNQEEKRKDWRHRKRRAGDGAPPHGAGGGMRSAIIESSRPDYSPAGDLILDSHSSLDY